MSKRDVFFLLFKLEKTEVFSASIKRHLSAE